METARKLSPYPWVRKALGKVLSRGLTEPIDIARADVWAGDVYVIFAFCLSLAAWLFAGLSDVTNVVICAYAIWRVVEVVMYQLGVVILDVKGDGVASLSRSILSSMLNIVEVVVLFAALEHILASAGFVDPSRLPFGAYVPKSPGGWLYVSWTTLFTLGSTYAVTEAAAKALVMAEVGAGLLLIAVVLASFVGSRQQKELSAGGSDSDVDA